MPKKKKKSLRNDARGYSTGGMNTRRSSVNDTTPTTTIPRNNNSTRAKNKKQETLDKVGKGTRSVQVSTKAYNELMCLMDELKQSMFIFGDKEQMNDHEEEISPKKRTTSSVIGNVSNGNKRFVKKVTFLNDNLQQLGFSEEQIKQVLIALICGHGRTVRQINKHSSSSSSRSNTKGMMNPTVDNVNILSLDDALDWLCLNLQSNELPKLFTDINHRQENQEINLGVIKASQEFETKDDENNDNNNNNDKNNDDINETEDKEGSIIDEINQMKINELITNYIYKEGTEREDNFLSLQDNTITNKKNKEKENNEHTNISNDEAAKRIWLLSQYQYHEEESVEDEANKGDEKEGVSTSAATNPQMERNQNNCCAEEVNKDDGNEQESRPTYPEEIRLEQLEKEVEELRADVNNEANNYMRSKHEIANMKKQLKKMDNQAKKLRAKVAKMIEVYESKKVQSSHDNGENKKGNNDDVIMEEEDDEEEGYGTNLFDIPVESSTVESDHPIVKKIEYIEVEIPTGWSGKTPKQLLLEHCRKNKWPKPSFSRMENTTNGCIIKLKKRSHHDAIIHAKEGPFRTLDDAEHYVSTKALYVLNPELQIYLMMPPSFRDLWTGWTKEKREKEDMMKNSVANERKDKISSLIAYLGNAVNIDGTNTSLGDDGVGTEEHAIANWDDESLKSNYSDSFDLMNANIISQCKEVTSHSKMGENLKRKFKEKQMQVGYQKMFKSRKSLPIHSFRQDILNTVRDNAVTVLCAETGAGKTTQCPQFILEEALLSGVGDKANIICTQPRRISALSVAERVADEIDDNVGNQVGYHIRMESKKSKHTKLLFCTTGVVLRRLHDDPNLIGVTHVIVDEVHERQWEIDFLLIALRRLLNTTRKTDLKVILMSATLDSKLFCNFFQGAPFLSIPGRTFPVSEYYLEDVIDATDHFIEEDSRYAIREHYDVRKETLMVTSRGGEKRRETVSLDDEAEVSELSDDYRGYKISTMRSMARIDEKVLNYDLIEDLLTLLLVENKTNANTSILPPGCETSSESNLSNGSILIFLPGMGEIRTLHDRLQGSKYFGNSNRFDIIPMHSTLSPKDQKRAFMKPKAGCQKVILATNIAETSITIDDCVCVIDSGLVREVIQDKRSSTSKLITAWCSKASSKQRAGRAGRVQPGICCKLYSSKTANRMKKQSIPELQRIPLEEVCLTILGANLASNCMDFLMQAPEPPSNEAVSNALTVLEEVDAIEPLTSSQDGTRLEIITPLGQHLAKLPVHIRLGKMLIFGALFKVLDKTLTIAASLSSKSPFVANIDNSHQAAAAHKAFAHPSSDFMKVCNVWDAYRAACEISSSNGRRFCEKNYLSRAAFLEIEDTRKQFIQLLTQIGFIDPSYLKTAKTISTSHYNKYASNENILSAVICAGLYPNCAHVLSKSMDEVPTIWQKKDQLWFHKSSINHNKKKIDSDWIIYHEKFATHKVFVSTTGLVKPFSLLLFGKNIDIKFFERKVVVDDWIELKLPAQTGVMFRELREEMYKVLGSRIICLDDNQKGEALIEKVTKLLKLEF